MAISSYSIARALLKEKYALNAKTTQEALLDSRTCLRYFPSIPMGKVSECLDCLRTIASVKNPKASHTVLNPQVNKEELPGTWRHIQEYAEPPRAKTEPDVQDVYQLLKLDWITSIATDASKWTHAKWLKHEVSQQVGNAAGDKEQVLHVIFRNVSPQHLGSIATALQAQTTFINPVIFGKTVTGTFSVYLVKPTTETDGSGTVEILMGNSKFQVTTFGNLDTPREYDEINLYGVAKDLQVGIIAAWKALAVKGSYSYPRYDSANHTVDLTLRTRVSGKSFTKLSIITSWDGFTKTYEDVYFGLMEAEADLVGLGSPATWLITTTYPVGARVSYLGYYYVSLKTSNLGYTPIGNPTWWEKGTAVTAPVVWPPQGQAWRCNKRFDESDAMWTVFVTREFALAVNVAESVVRYSEREIVYETEGIHDLTKPTITAPAAGTVLAISKDLDRFLTWNWKKRRTVKITPNDDGISWTEWGDLYSVSEQSMTVALETNRMYISKVYIYQDGWIHTIKYFANATDAAAYAYPTLATEVLPTDPNANGFSAGFKTKYGDYSRSNIAPTGESEWRVDRVSKVGRTTAGTLRYTYRYDPPTE